MGGACGESDPSTTGWAWNAFFLGLRGGGGGGGLFLGELGCEPGGEGGRGIETACALDGLDGWEL